MKLQCTSINKVIASFKLEKVCMAKGIRKEKRLFDEIMKDEKVLPSGNLVEAGRADLVGDHVGAAAPLVKKKFKEAQGGVLFIDETDSLCDNGRDI